MLTTTNNRPSFKVITPRISFVGMEAFDRLSDITLQEARNCAVEKDHKKGDTLFRYNDSAASLWFVKRGLVRESNHSIDGKEKILGIFRPGGLLGTSAFIGKEYGSRGMAETDGTTLRFPVQKILEWMSKDIAVTVMITLKMADLLQRSRDRLAVWDDPAEKRILHTLLEMIGQFGPTVPLGRTAIGHMAGTTPETCSRIFTRLRKAGLLTTHPGGFFVPNPSLLQERIQRP